MLDLDEYTNGIVEMAELNSATTTSSVEMGS